MDRFRLAEQRIKSREEIVKERYRANLLRAISHDVRTPLAGMIGTAEMLMDMTGKDDPRYELAQVIKKDADWLHSLVENILNLTRLQDGKLVINKQREAVEEIIGVAVSRISVRAPEHEISVNVPDELLLVPMDAKLIEQVIINLLDNAVRHTKPDREIGIAAEICENADMIKFTVKDRGTGIRKKDLPNIFQVFYTSYTKHADAKHGIGLGLAICETIVKAHGGSIEAHNRTDGPGAEFTFTLPMEDETDE
jgi:two-component system sensor histidine kinase KdpD